MAAQFWAGARIGTREVITTASTRTDTEPDYRVVSYATHTRAYYAWGSCSAKALRLARLLILASVGEQADQPYVEQALVEKHVSQWRECWSITSEQIRDFVEGELLWEFRDKATAQEGRTNG